MNLKPLVYLSKTAVREIWPRLKSSRPGLRLGEVGAKLALGGPELSGTWSREAPPWKGDWPPDNSEELVDAIEDHFYNQCRVGSAVDLQERPGDHDAFYVSGRLRFSATTKDQAPPVPFEMADHTFAAVLETDGASFGIVLANENLAGLSLVNGTWQAHSSLVHLMLRGMSRSDGVAIDGLFTHGGHHDRYAATARAIFLRMRRSSPSDS